MVYFMHNKLEGFYIVLLTLYEFMRLVNRMNVMNGRRRFHSGSEHSPLLLHPCDIFSISTTTKIAFEVRKLM